MTIEIINQCIMRTCELFTENNRKYFEFGGKDRRSLNLNDNYKFDTPRHSDLRDQNLNNETLVQIKITGKMNFKLYGIDTQATVEKMKSKKNKKNDFQKSNYIQICSSLFFTKAPLHS